MKKAQRGVWPTACRQVASEQSLLHNRSQNDLGSNAPLLQGRKEKKKKKSNKKTHPGEQRVSNITGSISWWAFSTPHAAFRLSYLTDGGTVTRQLGLQTALD